MPWGSSIEYGWKRRHIFDSPVAHSVHTQNLQNPNPSQCVHTARVDPYSDCVLCNKICIVLFRGTSCRHVLFTCDFSHELLFENVLLIPVI